jgi:hypothetical protein
MIKWYMYFEANFNIKQMFQWLTLNVTILSTFVDNKNQSVPFVKTRRPNSLSLTLKLEIHEPCLFIVK